MGYVLVVLGWISFILSIVLKRLPGLEAMFVLQTAFMVFVCLNAYMLTPFQGTSPLKYSTGYNYLFISESSEQQQYQSEMSAPYFNRFGLSRTLLVNNFNLCMVLELVSLVAVLVTHVRLKNQVNEHVNK